MRIIVLIFLLSPFYVSAQLIYNHVDRYVKNLDIKTKNTLKISHQLTEPFATDAEKIRAIYIWVGSNIEYDWDLYRNKKLKLKLAKKKIKKRLKRSLKKRKAICSGYSELFQVLAHAAEIDCEVIEGYSKTRKSELGRIRKADHAWNIAKINGEWKLFDVTWSTHYILYPTLTGNIGHPYFMADSEKFNYNHLPLKEYWKLNSHGIDKEKFKNLPLVHGGFFLNSFSLNKNSENGIIEIDVDEPFSIQFSSDKKVRTAEIKLGKKFFEAELTYLSERDYELRYTLPKKGNYYCEIYLDGMPTINYLVKAKKTRANSPLDSHH